MSSLCQLTNEQLTSVSQWAGYVCWPMSSWFRLANEQLISVGQWDADISMELRNSSNSRSDRMFISYRNSIISSKHVQTDQQTCAILQMLSHLITSWCYENLSPLFNLFESASWFLRKYNSFKIEIPVETPLFQSLKGRVDLKHQNLDPFWT